MAQDDGRIGRDGWQIGEAARRAGISVRALRHYDRIGLLAPSRVTQAGYRLYDEAALLRLEQILFFRELGFSLCEIRRIMESPSYDMREAMRRQHGLLCQKRRRLDAMIARLERAMDGDGRAELEVFDMNEIERMKRQYADEVRERWGGTPAYEESLRRDAARDETQALAAREEMEALMREFAGVRGLLPDDARVQALVARWQACITRHDYTCTDEILSGLGQLYACDARFAGNIDQFGEGTAACMSRAIAAYCARRAAVGKKDAPVT